MLNIEFGGVLSLGNGNIYCIVLPDTSSQFNRKHFRLRWYTLGKHLPVSLIGVISDISTQTWSLSSYHKCHLWDRISSSVQSRQTTFQIDLLVIAYFFGEQLILSHLKWENSMKGIVYHKTKLCFYILGICTIFQQVIRYNLVWDSIRLINHKAVYQKT